MIGGRREESEEKKMNLLSSYSSVAELTKWKMAERRPVCDDQRHGSGEGNKDFTESHQTAAPAIH